MSPSNLTRHLRQEHVSMQQSDRICGFSVLGDCKDTLSGGLCSQRKNDPVEHAWDITKYVPWVLKEGARETDSKNQAKPQNTRKIILTTWFEEPKTHSRNPNPSSNLVWEGLRPGGSICIPELPCHWQVALERRGGGQQHWWLEIHMCECLQQQT